ncbi:MAG: glycosyltransferase family 39 protein [Planctomycetes bacterium]|nr:glycosyltransferase family 39 protein [Planctomycetota bacterium]
MPPRLEASSSLLPVVLVLAVLAVSSFSHLHNRQLGALGGMTDEWFDLGMNLRLHGSLAIGDALPVLLRPPGYPAFIAAVVPGYARLEAATEAERAAHSDRCRGAVQAAQSVLLALSSALLFLWLRGRLRPALAALAALLFGTNPYAVLLTGLLHYDVLHIFFIIGCGYALDRAVEARARPGLAIFFAGAAWGLATLVRPVTLLLPLFVLGALLLRFRPDTRKGLRLGLLFGLGMALAIAPWTLRNFRQTGRLVLVNAQGWTAFWGATVKPLPIDPNRFLWYRVYPESYAPVFERATGRSYSYEELIRSALPVEDAFRAEALANVARDPACYAGNVATSLLAFNVGINSVFVEVFQRLQRTPDPPSREWFRPGSDQTFLRTGAGTVFAWWTYALTACGLFGLVRGLASRDPTWLVAGAIYGCLCVAHAVTWMDLMYYYVKFPFLLLFCFRFLGELRPREVRLPGLARGVPLGPALGTVFALVSFGLTAAVL